MATELVDVLLTDIASPHDPIAGVVVFVYDTTGTTQVTSGTTDATGHVQFMLPGGVTPTRYQLRTYKQGISSPQPTYVEVYSPPVGTNNFQLEAVVFTLPQSSDPRLCRVSGYIRWPDGRPKRGAEIHFIHRFSPLVIDGTLSLGERVTCRTDKDGYVQVDLWRNGQYRAIVEGHENVGRFIYVPDLTAANISYVLFPRVEEVVFDPPGPWSVAVGDSIEVMVEVRLTSGYVIAGTAPEDVDYTLPAGDPSVALQVLDDRIVLRGAVSGAPTLTLTRADATLIYVPDNAIIGSGNAISVV